MADLIIRQSFRQRRVAGGLLVFLGLPLTLFWARFGLPLRYDFGDLIFIMGGPGMLLLGLWAAFPTRTPQVRLKIGDTALHINNRKGGTLVPISDLQRIKKVRPISGKFDRLTFEAGAAEAVIDVAHMTHDADEIINLISMRLERRGKFLRQGRTDVMGAPNGIWEVQKGNPFDK